MNLKTALETNEPISTLTTLIKDPAIQSESLGLLASDHTPTFVFLKNAVHLALRRQGDEISADYLNRIYAAFIAQIYACSDFNFRVLCLFVEAVADTIRIRIDGVRAPASSGERARFLAVLGAVFVRYERAAKTNALFEEIDYYARETGAFLLDVLRTDDGNRAGALRALYSLIYQDMHHVLEEGGLPAALQTHGDNRVLALCLAKYADAMDMDALLARALVARNFELLALVLERMPADAALRDGVLQAIRGDLAMSARERHAAETNELAYFRDVMGVDTYRGGMHRLLRAVATGPDALHACPDQEAVFFVAAVTRVRAEGAPADRRAAVTFYRMLLCCGAATAPFCFEGAAARAYSCMRAEHALLRIDERDFLSADEHSAFLLRASVWHRTRAGEVVDGAVVQRITEYVTAVFRETTDVRVFCYFVDVLELCGADVSGLAEQILNFRITELAEIAVFVVVKKFWREGGRRLREMLAGFVESFGAYISEEVRDLVGLVTGGPCGFHERFLFLIPSMTMTSMDSMTKESNSSKSMSESMGGLMGESMGKSMGGGSGVVSGSANDSGHSANDNDHAIRNTTRIPSPSSIPSTTRIPNIRGHATSNANPFNYDFVLSSSLEIRAPFRATIVHKEPILAFVSLHSPQHVLSVARDLAAHLAANSVRVGYEREMRRAVRVVKALDAELGGVLESKVRGVWYGLDLNDRWPLFVLELFGIDCYS